MRYKHRRPESGLQLVLVGEGEPVPRHPSIHTVQTDWSDRDAMYRSATVFCQPSTNESLSIVLMQSWLAQRPALVHADCEVTRDHCQRSNGGLWFKAYAEFEAVMDRLLSEEPLRQAMGRAGESWVRLTYSWEAVLQRFEQATGDWLNTGAAVR